MRHLVVAIGIILLACQSTKEPEITPEFYPIDKNATAETVALYNNLMKVGKTNLLYGHQDD